MKTIWLILVNAVVLYLSTLIIPTGIQSDAFLTTIWAATIVAGCNYIAFKTIIGLTLTAILLSISGIFGIIGAAFMVFAMEALFLYTANWLLVGFTITGFWWAMLVVTFLGIGNYMFLPKNKNTQNA
jgi:uncharacterized membrane protein YvlD (DUF360 family)